MKKILIGLIIFCVFFTAGAKESEGSKEYYDKNYVLVYEVEGNFVDTEKKAKLYVYGGKQEYEKNSIVTVICSFFADKRHSAKTYEMPLFRTAFFTNTININDTPLQEFGEQIKIGDFIYGTIADINDNGLDELYLYELTGRSFHPAFFEYNPEKDAFESIIEYDGAANTLRFQSVDLENRQLTFKGFAIANTPVDEEVVYTWSVETGMYEITSRVRIPRQ